MCTTQDAGSTVPMDHEPRFAHLRGSGIRCNVYVCGFIAAFLAYDQASYSPSPLSNTCTHLPLANLRLPTVFCVTETAVLSYICVSHQTQRHDVQTFAQAIACLVSEENEIQVHNLTPFITLWRPQWQRIPTDRWNKGEWHLPWSD